MIKIYTMIHNHTILDRLETTEADTALPSEGTIYITFLYGTFHDRFFQYPEFASLDKHTASPTEDCILFYNLCLTSDTVKLYNIRNMYCTSIDAILCHQTTIHTIRQNNIRNTCHLTLLDDISHPCMPSDTHMTTDITTSLTSYDITLTHHTKLHHCSHDRGAM